MNDDTRLDATLRRLDALLDWERRERAQMRVDLAPVSDLLQRLGQPQRAFRSVHVAGTKGKGSVCALVAAGLRSAGLRAGRYTSPHVERLAERIVIDGQPIADGPLATALEAALQAREQAARAGGPGGVTSRFDVLTAAAFHAFRAAGLPWGVVEVGLGGLLDSTNVIDADVAVITNIGLEHTEVLGHHVEQIAAHKAGIVKPGCTLVTTAAPDEPIGPPIYGAAAAAQASVRRVVVSPDASLAQTNRAIARAVLDALGERGVLGPRRGAPLGAADLPDDVADAASLPARLERFDFADGPGDRTVPVVLDAAHVGFALAAVLRDLARWPGLAAPPTVLLALAGDKDAGAMLEPLRGRARRVVCVTLPGPRAGCDAQQLARQAGALGLPAEAADSVAQALASGLQQASAAPGGWLLVTGTFGLATALRPLLLAGSHRAAAGRREVPPGRDAQKG